jgi:hypothetical protein
MADSEKISIQPLSSENYGTWKIQLKLYLTHKGLNSCIEPEERTEEQLAAKSAESKAKEAADQKKALALIGLKVKPEFLGVIKDADGSARTPWEKFTEIFQSVTNARKLMLRQKLATLKMEPGEKVAMYIFRARDLRRDLMQAGLNTTEVDLAAACGLSREFREIRIMLEYRTDKISLDQMLPMLLQHEARLEKDAKDEGERTTSTAFAAKGRQSNWK